MDRAFRDPRRLARLPGSRRPGGRASGPGRHPEPAEALEITEITHGKPGKAQDDTLPVRHNVGTPGNARKISERAPTDPAGWGMSK